MSPAAAPLPAGWQADRPKKTTRIWIKNRDDPRPRKARSNSCVQFCVQFCVRFCVRFFFTVCFNNKIKNWKRQLDCFRFFSCFRFLNYYRILRERIHQKIGSGNWIEKLDQKLDRKMDPKLDRKLDNKWVRISIKEWIRNWINNWIHKRFDSRVQNLRQLCAMDVSSALAHGRRTITIDGISPVQCITRLTGAR